MPKRTDIIKKKELKEDVNPCRIEKIAGFEDRKKYSCRWGKNKKDDYTLRKELTDQLKNKVIENLTNQTGPVIAVGMSTYHVEKDRSIHAINENLGNISKTSEDVSAETQEVMESIGSLKETVGRFHV